MNIQLLLEQRPNTTVIPAAAVQRGPDGTFVYSVKQDSTVQMQPVTVALTQNNQAAIAQGVQPGDVVVTDGQDKLQNGMKIEARTGGPRGGGANPATGAGASGQNSAAASPGAMPGGSQAASSSPVMGEQQTPSGGTVGQVGSNPAVSTARPTTQSGEERRNQPQQGSGIR
ncbi:MAG: hypothetical protein H0X25_20970 [Acidobacteriales bacterium]|nr:hypothetical protein [Terriglobales bacterium]